MMRPSNGAATRSEQVIKEYHNMEQKLSALIKDNIAPNIAPKIFSTGSTGYYAGGKLVVDGKRYQVSLNVIEIGSKPQ
jgi:hypothetical protein